MNSLPHASIKEPQWWKEKLKPYDGKYSAVFQTRPEKGEPIINKEEWNPSAETLGKLKKNHKTLDASQKEKAELLR